MGKVNDRSIILSNIINDGIVSGYTGNRLKDYVVGEAKVEFGMDRVFVEGFVDSTASKIEGDIFNG